MCLSVSLYVSLSLCLPFSIMSLSVFLFLPPPLSISLSLCLPFSIISLCVCLFLPPPLSISVSLFVSFYITVFVPLCHFLSPFSVSVSRFVYRFVSFSLFISRYPAGSRRLVDYSLGQATNATAYWPISMPSLKPLYL